MPKKSVYNPNIHSSVYLVMALLYLLGCIGFDKTAVGAGLAICHYLLYRL